jgi:hypothetical protein
MHFFHFDKVIYVRFGFSQKTVFFKSMSFQQILEFSCFVESCGGFFHFLAFEKMQTSLHSTTESFAVELLPKTVEISSKI